MTRGRQIGFELAPFFLRLVFGIIFIVHGATKLMGLPKAIASFDQLGILMPTLSAPAIAGLEFVGGVVLILGLGWLTRLAALLLAATMVVAIFAVKLNQGLVHGFEFELALLAGLISLALSGPGSLAIMRERRRERELQRQMV
jgi:putative oxidoreductase